MTTANKLTILRVLLIPVFIWLLYADFAWSAYLAAAVFIIASVTDAVDGYIARNYNQITTFGKFMDPLADKLLVAAALICFVELGYVSAVAAIVVISREFIVTGIRILAVNENKVIAASGWGKVKTVAQIAVIIAVLVDRNREIFVFYGVDAVNWAVWVMVIFTVISGVHYIWGNRKLIHLS